MIWTADGRTLFGGPTRKFLGSGDWTVLNREGDQSGPGNQQGYEPGNVFVNGSNQLEIKAEKVTSFGHPYRSGMIQWTSLSFTTGTIEVSARMPSATGAWPALWFLGTGLQAQNIITADDSATAFWPYANTNADECDFLEFLGSNYSSNNCQVHVNFGTSPGGTTIDDGPGSVALGFDASAALHTYQFIRTASSLTWKADGATLGSLSGAHVSTTPWFLIMNVAMGGAGGTITDGTLPSSMLVDYVKVS